MPSPYVILVQVDLRLSHPENALPEVVWFFSKVWSCGEASVFALVESYLVCRL